VWIRSAIATSPEVTFVNKVEVKRIAGTRATRCLGRVFFVWIVAGLMARADDAGAPTNASLPAAPGSFLQPMVTNSGATSFLQLHPELPTPAPGEQQALSLQPGAATNAAPEVHPSNEELPDIPPGGDPLAPVEDLAAHLLVVYNTKDPDSGDLAHYYAARRNIPGERILAITCPVTEEITRKQFDETIRSPIVDYLVEKNWMERDTKFARVGNHYMNLLVAKRNDIWAIVLMRGVPLKIAPDPSDTEGLQTEPLLLTNAAAVDNELALLPVFGLPKGGFVPNIFFEDQLNGIKRIGPELARNMVMVTRLDGPTVADVRRMIDDCINAETTRLAGEAVIDTRNLTDKKNGYTVGDDWLRTARDALVKDGWHVRFDDKPEVLPSTDPCNHVALYLGWYAEQATGPWITPPNRFVPGAIAYHLHSYSASTVRSTTEHWVGPLISHGADATMGMVYEPVLALTPHEDIFTRRLLQGAYFAEAAYASERGLSWMMTVVGDPLYRPFKVSLDAALAQGDVVEPGHDDWLTVQKVNRELVSGTIPITTESLTGALDVPGAGAVIEEDLGDLLGKLNDDGAAAGTETAYRKAMAKETTRIDRIRVGLKLSAFFDHRGEKDKASTEVQTLQQLFPDDAKQFGIAPPSPSPAEARNDGKPVTAPVAPDSSSARNSIRPPSLPKPTPSP
jgi:uncharacterized protein (TIGR03790 family)